MENQTTFHMKGHACDGKLDAGGFVIDEKGVHSFVVDHSGALEDAGLDELGWHVECLAYRRGGSWHFKSSQPHTQGPDHLRLEEMRFTSQNRVDDVCVFLNGQKIGEGKEARIACDFGQENEAIIRVGGWPCVARFRGGRWHRQDRWGDLHEVGCLTIGPADFHQPLAAIDSLEWHCRPEPRLRPSSLASARLAFRA
jgi:hypothetical protein